MTSEHVQVDHAQLLDAVGDAIVVCDGAGAIILWNAGAERMFGFTKEEALGASLDIIIPERQRKRHWDGYYETMRTGVTRYGSALLRVPALHKDGHALSIAFTVALLSGADGRPTSIVSMIRDETERWKEERALQRRVAELEAKVGQTPAPQ
ncbi:PAS domain-containing protein [Xanthobacter tagetidis]|jgi:PAS domain S-box-containing protein|uniref:PAS domain S-box protein n=1 Tax=Xanthobacter tagetidis TaxID=60216 RepID=A0A3L6ZTM0_9HYPH|nr:PAS domain S-box protein [Xanthobacter tagetidis]MBB6309985.1 PAS domain S-box-containing protein [Xanthobacter tagetidis]RLP71306.1 PAS domain S-box protein [Xanthobacter tagetidis]